MKYAIESAGAMNGPHVKKDPKMMLEVRMDHMGADSGYRSQRKEELGKKHKMLKKAMKDMTPESAMTMLKACYEKEMKRCDMEMSDMEDGPSISDAYDSKDEKDDDK